MIRTTVITPTIGTDQLVEACESVAKQTVQCIHLLVIDGEEYKEKALELALAVQMDNPATYVFKTLVLPFNTGANGVNGHRAYAAAANISPTPFFSLLDEDNWIAHNWVQTMQNAMDRNPESQFVSCRRTVTYPDRQIIGRDNKESIGENQMGYRLYDTSTLMFRASMAIMMPYMAIRYYTDDPHKTLGDRDLINAIWKVPHTHLEDYHGTYYRSPERLIPFFKEICNE
jgi:hypothetical protein